jgi:hypothetical protein
LVVYVDTFAGLCIAGIIGAYVEIVAIRWRTNLTFAALWIAGIYVTGVTVVANRWITALTYAAICIAGIYGTGVTVVANRWRTNLTFAGIWIAGIFGTGVTVVANRFFTGGAGIYNRCSRRGLYFVVYPAAARSNFTIVIPSHCSLVVQLSQGAIGIREIILNIELHPRTFIR